MKKRFWILIGLALYGVSLSLYLWCCDADQSSNPPRSSSFHSDDTFLQHPGTFEWLSDSAEGYSQYSPWANNKERPGVAFNVSLAKLAPDQWTFNQDEKEFQLKLYKSSRLVLQCDVQVAGTYSLKTETYKWAWANETIHEALRKASEAPKEYGLKNGAVEYKSWKELSDQTKSETLKMGRANASKKMIINSLTTPEYPSDLGSALNDAHMVNFLAKGSGVYSAKDSERVIYLVVTRFEEVKPENSK
jgi:hypothetical protein